MLYITCRAQEGIGFGAASDSVCLEFSDEQQHFAAPLPVVNVSLTGGGVCRCGALALPVEETFIDGVVLVQRCGGIVLIGFV